MPDQEFPSSDNPTTVSSDEVEARAALVLTLRGHGIGDTAVLSAIERVPRRLFLTARHHKLAYEDSPLPIECGQIVSAPSRVAQVAQALELSRGHCVLEVGTGSGYQAAVLGHLAERVDSLDRYKTLVSLAAQRTAALKLGNVAIHHADGFAGLRQHAPFDRIVLTGAVSELPPELLLQLRTPGILIAPVGAAGQPQVLTRLRRTDAGDVFEKIDMVRVTTLVPGQAQKL